MAREQGWISDTEKARAREERALAVEKDRQVRLRSVANDTFLNLPVSVPRRDGEEYSRRTNSQSQSYDQHSEIQKGYIQGPPNKTIYDSDWKCPCSCSSGGSQPSPKSSSTGQLSNLSWSGLSWSRSGKSPPSHSRTRCHHHQRHSHPSNAKNACSSSSSVSGCKHKNSVSSSSSTCSSTSSSKSSSTTLLVGAVNSGASGSCSGTGHCKTSSGVLSIGEKIQSAITEKVQQCTSTMVGNSRTSPNNNSSTSGVLSRLSSKGVGRNSKSGKHTSSECSSTSKGMPVEVQKQQQMSVVGSNPNGAPSACVRSDSTTIAFHPMMASQSEANHGGLTQLCKTSGTGTVFISSDTGTQSERRLYCSSLRGPVPMSSSEQSRWDSNDSSSDNNGNAEVPPLIGEPIGDNRHRLLGLGSAVSGSTRKNPTVDRDQSGCEALTNSSLTNDQKVHHHLSSQFGVASGASLDMSDAHDRTEMPFTNNQPHQYCAKNLSSTSVRSKVSDQSNDLASCPFKSGNS